MVPKIVHYCWFGKGKKSELVQRCISSWQKYLPDYEIKEWNETNFDVTINDFVKNAYAQKKWAFVSDYCRLLVLEEQGGIYLDTDVEVIKSFDGLLDHEFIGYEQKEYLCTAVLGFERNNPFIERMLHLYDEGGLNYEVPNSKHFFNMIAKECDLPKISEEIIDLPHITVYPASYFSPKNFVTKKIKLTDETYCIHHFDGTWKSGRAKFKDRIQNTLIRMLGAERYYRLKGKLKKSVK